MPRHLRLIPFILCLYFTWFWVIESALADGMPMPFYREVLEIPEFLVIFGLTTVFPILVMTIGVEYVVIFFLLGRPAKAKMQLLFYTALVNVITNPAAQLCFFLICDPILLKSKSLEYLVLFTIELVVVIAEFGLMRWIFGRMYRQGVLDKPVYGGRVLVISVVANITSFVTAFSAYIVLVLVLGHLGWLR